MKVNLTIKPDIIPARFRMGWFPVILLVLAGIAFVIAMIRFISGIGAISNLNNAYPWAFRVSFDLFTGIAISSGAFILASIIRGWQTSERATTRTLVRPSFAAFTSASMWPVPMPPVPMTPSLTGSSGRSGARGAAT